MRVQVLWSTVKSIPLSLSSIGRGRRREDGSQTGAPSRSRRRRPTLTVALLAAAVLVLSSCQINSVSSGGGPISGDWPQFRMGPEHSGYNAAESTIGVGNVGNLVEKWTSASVGVVSSSPAVVNGVAYVGSEDDNLYAFDATGINNCSGTPKTCAPLWTGGTGGNIFSSPAVSNGMVYVGSTDGKLHAF